MPPLPGKTKTKGRDPARSSRSRNTTPSSNVSAPISTIAATSTTYLDIPIDNLMIHSGISYDDILERHGGGGGIPDPKHLEAMADNLKALSQRAEARGQACDGAMRELVVRQKEMRLADEQRLKEKAMRDKAAQEAAEKESLRKAAEEEEGAKSKKALNLKKKKEQTVKENRPLTHGAHGLARQDGSGLPVKGVTEERKANRDLSDPPEKKRRKLDAVSGSSSPLSPPAQATSPTLAQPKQHIDSVRRSRSLSSSSLDSHQPPPAPSVPQYQTFGPDPLAFDDPTIYHIREVTNDMTDEEKKDIYCVSHFPHDDLSHLIAGTPPDKDFSNAKPSNQVNANTFAAYIDPYLRPLTEEDMAFLKERGDRVTPFIMPRRGKKHYTEVWAEEDGSISVEKAPGLDGLPPNQARSSLENMDDDVAETDQVSAGPMINRLLSAMRFENRPPTEEKFTANGTNSPSTNGVGPSDAPSTSDPFTDSPAATLPPATFMSESNLPSWKSPTPKLTSEQMDERMKAELRHIGFLAPDSEPDYDAHYDDEVAERLRKLQAELKRVSIINGARKARVLELANERMAHQEYSTILQDLDGQVQQAYLERTRTLGKGKKNNKRPGGAGGGSHHNAGGANGAGGAAAGVTKPGIGNVARQLMTRRERWEGKIGPVFGGDVTRVRGSGEGIFGEEVMEGFVKRERERWDEEAE